MQVLLADLQQLASVAGTWLDVLSMNRSWLTSDPWRREGSYSSAIYFPSSQWMESTGPTGTADCSTRCWVYGVLFIRREIAWTEYLTLTAKYLAAELDGNRDAQLDNFDINIKDQINLPELFVHFSFEISFSFNFSLVFGQMFSFLFSFSFLNLF